MHQSPRGQSRDTRIAGCNRALGTLLESMDMNITEYCHIVAFDTALTVGQPVEARWTNNHRRHVAPATVKKVNAKSIIVLIDTAIYDDKDDVLYTVGHPITLPRSGNKDYSANNGAYPLAEANQPDQLLPDEELSVTHAATDDGGQAAAATDTHTAMEPPTIDEVIAAELAAGTLHRVDHIDEGLSDEELVMQYAADVKWSAEWEHGISVQDDADTDRSFFYTTAPEYADLGVRTESALGSIGNGESLPYWKVSVPAANAAMFTARCGTDLRNVHSEAEWHELVQQPFFQAKFVPTEHYVATYEALQTTPLAVPTVPLAPSVAAVVNAVGQAAAEKLINGRTFQREAKAQAKAEKAASKHAAAEAKAAPRPEAQAHREAEGASPVVADKAQYLIELVSQGRDAVHAALAQGRVTVRLPRQPRQPRPVGTPQSSTSSRNPDGVSPRQARFLLTRVDTGTFGGGTSAVRRELHRKGMIVNATQPDAALTAKGEALIASLRTTLATPGILTS